MHCLISEGGFSDDSFWRHISHFSYTFLRNAFRTALLDEMESIIGPSFKKIKASCYKEHKHGFYVYAKPNKCDPETVTKYIGRYLGRPVIATSRIDKYDGSMVTFHYNRHEDDKYVTETIPAIDFIKRLIRHIPEKHFKMIRYGGIYARHRKLDSSLRRAISPHKHRIYRSFNQWRTAILSSFGYDPLQCPKCKHQMDLIALYYNHQHVSLEEMYEKAMSRSHGKRCPVLMERDPLLKYHDFYVIIFLKRRIDQMKPDIETLRKKYIENPPEGMISRDILSMSEEALLDMDYFLNDDELDDDFGEEGFYLF